MGNKQFFGTDGIRGRVGNAPMTPDVVMKLAWAAGKILAQNHAHPWVLIGKDTRASGYLLESALQAGFAAAGVSVALLGPMPTPAIAYLTRTFRASAGVVISASHNPYYDNGIKFFNAEGKKLNDAQEAAMETQMQATMDCVDSAQIGRARRIQDAGGRYIEFCKSTYRAARSLENLKIVLDCANGAAYLVAAAVFRELGAEVLAIHDKPDGLNINLDCGSTHPTSLQQKVLAEKADLGIALDGDADRVLMVDHTGAILDGDQLLFIIAQHRKNQDSLHGAVVGTLMSNLALEQKLLKNNIDFVRANVGDRYVMEKLREHGGVLGGENSGHIVCLDRTTTGDGIVAALQVLAAMQDADCRLADFAAQLPLFPQILINVKLPAGISAKTIMARTELTEAQIQAENILANAGRILLRPSGTEPLIRVMVEGEDLGLVKNTAENLANIVRGLV